MQLAFNILTEEMLTFVYKLKKKTLTWGEKNTEGWLVKYFPGLKRYDTTHQASMLLTSDSQLLGEKCFPQRHLEWLDTWPVFFSKCD